MRVRPRNVERTRNDDEERAPVLELQIVTRQYDQFSLLTGHEEAELCWLAALLRRQCGVPANAE